ALASFRAEHSGRFSGKHLLRFLGDIVEQAARCARTVEHAGRPLQELDPLYIEQLRDRKPCVGIPAQAVEKDFLLAEAACGDASIAEEAYAREVPIKILGVARALVFNQLGIDDLD